MASRGGDKDIPEVAEGHRWFLFAFFDLSVVSDLSIFFELAKDSVGERGRALFEDLTQDTTQSGRRKSLVFKTVLEKEVAGRSRIRARQHFIRKVPGQHRLSTARVGRYPEQARCIALLPISE